MALSVFMVGAAATTARAADNFPSKPLRYIVPFAPGGATDLVGRLIGEQLSGKLGQQVVVENRSGAGGLIGTRFVAHSPPDGYTMVGVTFNYLVYPVLFTNPGIDILKDLAPVTQIVTYPSILVVPTNSPYKSVKDLVEDAKKNPGKLTYATSGVGTASHIAGELLNRDAGIKITHVPYRGGGPANIDVIAGHVTMHFANLGSSIQYIRGGQLRPLAVATAKRLPGFPDVPTMEESGFPDFLVNEFQGVLVPAATPPAIVARLNKEIVGILRTPEMQEKFESMGGQLVASSPAEFAAFIKSDSAKWTAVAKDAGIKPLE
ncbi:MAG TPA: tripartite tricarboxylate transporter substrate binding protein [Hyphomicrobium sp.]|nr:tripartite tricarboxylate transporter substrate binding protein [Hyphomicrobium sp.]